MATMYRDICVQSPRMALMGVSSQDWQQLQLLAEKFPEKVQPCFGIHPWKAHLHSSNAFSGTVADTLDPATVNDDLPDSLHSSLIHVRSTQTRSATYAANCHDQYHELLSSYST